MKPTDQQLQEIYEEAVSAEVAVQKGTEMALFDLLCKLDDVGGMALFIITMIDDLRATRREATYIQQLKGEQEPVGEIVEWHGTNKEKGILRDKDFRFLRFDVAPGPLYTVPQPALKDNQIRELVNELRDIAIKYHSAQQLRERIARAVRATINSQQ